MAEFYLNFENLMKSGRPSFHIKGKWVVVNIPGSQRMAFKLDDKGNVIKNEGKIEPDLTFDFNKADSQRASIQLPQRKGKNKKSNNFVQPIAQYPIGNYQNPNPQYYSTVQPQMSSPTTPSANAQPTYQSIDKQDDDISFQKQELPDGSNVEFIYGIDDNDQGFFLDTFDFY